MENITIDKAKLQNHSKAIIICVQQNKKILVKPHISVKYVQNQQKDNLCYKRNINSTKDMVVSQGLIEHKQK